MMKWIPGKTLGQEDYTALKSDDGKVEYARYWHRQGGFVPDGSRNNAKPRRHEAQARYDLLRQCLVRVECDRLDLQEALEGIDLENAENLKAETLKYPCRKAF